MTLRNHLAGLCEKSARLLKGPAALRSPAGHFPLFASLKTEAVYRADGRPGSLVFVLPRISKGSGGIADILCLGEEIRRLQRYDVAYLLPADQPAEETVPNCLWIRPDVPRASLLERLDFVPDLLCATAWMTVYRALGIPSKRKLYFVQDDEPSFYPAGVEKFYIERTYTFGLPMITLGPWMASRLKGAGLQGPIGSIPFPASDAVPDFGGGRRHRIMFYMQPDKRQRGSELLLEAARRVARHDAVRSGTYTLTVFGSHVNTYIAFDFPCEAHGVLSAAELKKMMKETRVGVCASFSNISLLPFRFVAHGAVAVDLDLPNVRMNIPERTLRACALAAPSAEALADCVTGLLDAAAAASELEPVAADLCATNSWVTCARAFSAFVEDLHDEAG